MMKTKIGKRQVDNGSQKIRYTPLEDSFHLASMLRIGLGGRRIGAYIQKKGLNSFQVRFWWECKGIHSTLRSEEIDPIFDALEAGLKDLPNNESLTIHLGSFTSDNERQTELANLSKSAPNKELRYLLMGERVRVQELTRQGIRKPKFLRLYATYTVEPDTQGTADLIEKFLARAQRWWKSFTGEIHEVQHTRIERLLYSSFTDGYELWEQLLSNKLGLDVRPFNIATSIAFCQTRNSLNERMFAMTCISFSLYLSILSPLYLDDAGRGRRGDAESFYPTSLPSK